MSIKAQNLLGVFLLLSFLSHQTRLLSQTINSEIEIKEHITFGREFLYLEEGKNAKKSFQSVLENDKNNIHALIGMGRVEMLRKKWGKAENWFDKVIKQDPNNLFANYYIGICKREIGTNRVLLQRLLAWRGSQKHFNRVIEVDSSFIDAIYQLAILERYRDHYYKAIVMTHKQLKKNFTSKRTNRYF